MKKILILAAILFLGALSVRAQDTTGVVAVDSTLVGRSIMQVLGPGIEVIQTQTVRQALDRYTESNAQKPLSGYRIRVFYDNSPQARVRSESIEKTLRQQYPEVGVYRSFESPNYKVLLGNFRSKDEALRIFNQLKKTYPTAYIIKDNIEYPL